jgi:hypothetical protein
VQDQEFKLRTFPNFPNIALTKRIDLFGANAMTRVIRKTCVGLLTIGTICFLFAATNGAQEKKDKKAPPKHDGSALSDSLRDVINTGAKMYNDQGDHAGCYRLYQGSLLSVRPFVAAALQKNIDDGISKAEKMSSFADRAFELRRVLDEVRAAAKSGEKGEKGEKNEDKKDKKDEKDKKKDDKKKDDKKDEKDKKKDDKNKGEGKGQIAGKVLFDGKPLPGGYFVTLVGKDAKKHSSAIQKDGTFRFAAPVQTGKYRVAIEPIPGEKTKALAIPARYASEDNSSLVIDVQAGKQQVDLNLVK